MADACGLVEEEDVGVLAVVAELEGWQLAVGEVLSEGVGEAAGGVASHMKGNKLVHQKSLCFKDLTLKVMQSSVTVMGSMSPLKIVWGQLFGSPGAQARHGYGSPLSVTNTTSPPLSLPLIQTSSPTSFMSHIVAKKSAVAFNSASFC